MPSLSRAAWTGAALGAAIAAAPASPASAAALYYLHGETWRNLGGQGGAALLTSYQYDSHGNRVLKGVRPLPDSTGSFQASTRYTYDNQGRLVRAVLLDGADTSSLVDYAYNAKGDLSVFRTREKDGTLRLTDSLLYDNQSRLVETRRLAGGALMQAHVYRYDGQGRAVSDTVFERQGNAFNAAQAVLTAYDASGAAITESHFRVSGGVWYPVFTVKLRYQGPLLSSRTRYHGEGGGLADSVAYSYDNAGNRVKESGFDDEREPAYAIEYDWRPFGPGAVRPPDRGRGPILLSAAPGALELRADARHPLVLQVRDLRGALLGGATFPAGAGSWRFPPALARGRYLAEAAQGSERRSIPFTVP